MTPDRSESTDENHQVLPFRRRGGTLVAGGAYGTRAPAREPPAGIPDDFGKYEGGAVEDDYRHRMMVNLAALGVIVVLASAGAWLAITLADMRKTQDCFLSGRRNCAPIDMQTLQAR